MAAQNEVGPGIGVVTGVLRIDEVFWREQSQGRREEDHQARGERRNFDMAGTGTICLSRRERDA